MGINDLNGVIEKDNIKRDDVKTIRSVDDAKAAILNVKEILGDWPTYTQYNNIKNEINIGTGAGHFKRQTGYTFGEIKEMLMNKKQDIIEEYGDEYNIIDVRRSNQGYEVDLECKNCTDEYTVGMYRVRAGQKKFCNSSCAGSYDKELDLDKNKTLAYLGGVYVGDGSVGRYNNSETLFRLNTIDKIFRDKVGNNLEKINLEPYYFTQDHNNDNAKLQYCVRVRSLPFCNYIEDNFSKDNCITNIFNLRTDEQKRRFICGFYESEGTFDGKYTITMSQKNIKILRAIKYLLGDLNFKTSIYDYREKNNQVSLIRILGGEKERKRFFNEINPIIRNPLK